MKAQLIRHWQRPPLGGVVRPGGAIVPNRGRVYEQTPPPGFAKVTIATDEGSDGKRGFDMTPEAFGDIDPDEAEGITITESSVDAAGLVVLELADGAQFSDEPVPFGGLNAYIGEAFFRQIEMQWNAGNSRYESIALHPDFYAALGALVPA